MTKADPELQTVVMPAEMMMEFSSPLCSALSSHGFIDSSLSIVDLSNVGIKHFWSLRDHLGRASQLATARKHPQLHKAVMNIEELTLPRLS